MEVDRTYNKCGAGVYGDSVPRNNSLCAYTILDRKVFVVADCSQDDRFKDTPDVLAGLRFYAGAAIICAGKKIGTLCIGELTPKHDFDEGQQAKLRELADLVGDIVEARRQKAISHDVDEAKLIIGALHNLQPSLHALMDLKEKLRQILKSPADLQTLLRTTSLFKEKVGSLCKQIELSLLASHCPQYTEKEMKDFCQTTSSQALIDVLNGIVREQGETRVEVDSSLSNGALISCDNDAFNLISKVILSLWIDRPRTGANESVKISLSLSNANDNDQAPHSSHHNGQQLHIQFTHLSSEDNHELSLDESVVSHCSTLLCQQLSQSHHGDFHHSLSAGLKRRNCSFWLPCETPSIEKTQRELGDPQDLSVTSTVATSDDIDNCRTVKYADIAGGWCSGHLAEANSERSSLPQVCSININHDCSGRCVVDMSCSNSYDRRRHQIPSIILHPIIPNNRTPTSFSSRRHQQLPNQVQAISIVTSSEDLVTPEKRVKKSEEGSSSIQSLLGHLCGTIRRLVTTRSNSYRLHSNQLVLPAAPCEHDDAGSEA
eukprot:scaffold686_cov177-Ochromonas_danica.AAC.6